MDGCEPASGCQLELGQTEHALADLLISRGAFHAINLDGGGSSTAFAGGKVLHQSGYARGGYGAHGKGFALGLVASEALNGLVLLAGLRAL